MCASYNDCHLNEEFIQWFAFWFDIVCGEIGFGVACVVFFFLLPIFRFMLNRTLKSATFGNAPQNENILKPAPIVLEMSID